MKGFNKKSFITAMLISALACQIAQGASVKYEGNNINISGVISSKQKNLEVGIQIVGPFDSAIDDIDEVLDKDVSAEKELEKTYYTQIKTTDGGKYDFTLGGINNGKFYGVAIREPEGELITSKLYIAEQSMINIVLNKINTSGSSASIKEIFDTPEYYDMLVGNYTIFKSLSENDKNKVYNLIYEDKKSGFSNFAEFEKSIITSSAVVKTASETDPKKALAYSEEISFESADASLYEEYNKKNVIQKSEIIERVMKEKPANYKEYIERFNEACFLQKVQEVTYSTNITK